MALVRTDVGGEVATITLSRPEALNAISGEMAVEVAAAFRAVAGDERTRVVVLAAAGERAFCVGADLKERNRLDHAGWLANRERMAGMFAAIRETPMPTIASVFGFALGGGFELALSCDLIVAADDAVFGLPETTVGIVPGGGGTQLLARRCGLARAKELIFTGRRLAVEEAHAWGVVNRVAPPASWPRRRPAWRPRSAGRRPSASGRRSARSTAASACRCPTAWPWRTPRGGPPSPPTTGRRAWPRSPRSATPRWTGR